MEIVVLDGHALNLGDMSWQALSELGTVTIYPRTSYTDTQEIVERIGEAQAVFTNKTPITQEVLMRCPTIQYIGVLATGYNVVDVQAAKALGIPVTNIPSYGTNAVAQFTFALLLEIASQVGCHQRSVLAGDWQQSPDFSYWKVPLLELAGKTIGLVGYGAIAQAVATIAHAFQMKVVYSNHRSKEPQGDWLQQVSLEHLYQEADIISLHVPQMPETERMINRAAIQKMKDGVILLNTARGGLLDERAVAAALNSGKIAALGADVVAQEPINAKNPLLSAKNCYLTPHIAWAPVETRERLMQIAVNNLRAFLNGAVENQVNS